MNYNDSFTSLKGVNVKTEYYKFYYFTFTFHFLVGYAHQFVNAKKPLFLLRCEHLRCWSLNAFIHRKIVSSLSFWISAKLGTSFTDQYLSVIIHYESTHQNSEKCSKPFPIHSTSSIFKLLSFIIRRCTEYSRYSLRNLLLKPFSYLWTILDSFS